MIIIGIAGRKRSGKGSIAEALNTTLSFKRYSFGNKLKEIQKRMFPWLPESATHGEDRERVIFESPPDMISIGAPGLITCREVQQSIGQAARAVLGDRVWIEALVEQVNQDNPERVVIEDIRQMNELLAIKNSGGYIIRTNRIPKIQYHHFKDSAVGGVDSCAHIFDIRGEPKICARKAEAHPISWTDDVHETEWALPEDSIIYDRVINASSAIEAARNGLSFAMTLVGN